MKCYKPLLAFTGLYRSLQVLLIFTLLVGFSGCALDSTVIKWHDGKVVRVEGGSKSMVKLKIGDDEVTVDSRKPSILTDFLKLMMFDSVKDSVPRK